jgi:hypothetical protein
LQDQTDDANYLEAHAVVEGGLAMKVCVVQHFDVERRAADHQKGRNSARRTSLLETTYPTTNHYQ